MDATTTAFLDTVNENTLTAIGQTIGGFLPFVFSIAFFILLIGLLISGFRYLTRLK